MNCFVRRARSFSATLRWSVGCTTVKEMPSPSASSAVGAVGVLCTGLPLLLLSCCDERHRPVIRSGVGIALASWRVHPNGESRAGGPSFMVRYRTTLVPIVWRIGRRSSPRNLT